MGIIDYTGSVVARYSYDAWGKQYAVTNGAGVAQPTGNSTFIGHVNPIRYRGYYYDTETGLYYCLSRYYDPVVGRFINADGLIDNRNISTVNMFVYCGNNPVMNSDSDGKITIFGIIWNAFKSRLNTKTTVERGSIKTTGTSVTASGPKIVEKGSIATGAGKTLSLNTSQTVGYAEAMVRVQANQQLAPQQGDSKIIAGVLAKASAVNFSTKIRHGDERSGISSKTVIDVFAVSAQAGIKGSEQLGVGAGARASVLAGRQTICFDFMGREMEVGMDVHFMTAGTTGGAQWFYGGTVLRIQ